MKIRQASITKSAELREKLEPLAALAPSLVLVFAAPSFFIDGAMAAELETCFPEAELVGCSTAGEISMAGIQEDTAVVTAIHFDRTRIVSGTTILADMADSRSAGQRLAREVQTADLRAVLVFGQGIAINGSALVSGMTEVLGADIPLVGGLAGDNGAFARTWTIGKNGVSDHAIVAIGLAGENLRVSCGSFGGWEPFGPARKVTRSSGNVLLELDGAPALEIYKRYLGDYAKDLPASGLLVPFGILDDDLNEVGLIRTILGIDEAQGSLILAGEMVEGNFVKLMHASMDALVDGAERAATIAHARGRPLPSSLVLLISCVGRKLAMGDRTDEEVDAVAAVMGSHTVNTGFYSYGEIGPDTPGVSCKLHNQTMTITIFAET